MDVIMDVTDYMKKAERQLNNKDHFSQPANNETVSNVIERSQKENLIIKSLSERLRTT